MNNNFNIETLGSADQSPLSLLLLWASDWQSLHSEVPVAQHRVGANLVPLLVDVQRSSISDNAVRETPTAQNPKIVRKLVKKEILHQQGDSVLVPLVQKFIEQVVEEEE